MIKSGETGSRMEATRGWARRLGSWGLMRTGFQLGKIRNLGDGWGWLHIHANVPDATVLDA